MSDAFADVLLSQMRIIASWMTDVNYSIPHFRLDRNVKLDRIIAILRELRDEQPNAK